MKYSIYLLKDVVDTDATSSTLVSLVTSLACLSLLSCKESLDDLEKDREIYTLAVENFHGFVRGKDAKCPMLRRNLGYAVAETDKTYVFNTESRELSLTQQDEVKSVFPTQLVLLDSATGQVLIEQMFHMPRIVDLNYMSIAAFRRFRRITYHFRTPEKEELWKKAVGIPLHSFLTRNRVRKAEKKGEKQDENDHFLTRDTMLVEPLFVASGNRSADCVNRTHKKLPCYCQVESLWYTRKKCMMLVWEVDELESLGLPPKEADIVVFSVKHFPEQRCTHG